MKLNKVIYLCSFLNETFKKGMKVTLQDENSTVEELKAGVDAEVLKDSSPVENEVSVKYNLKGKEVQAYLPKDKIKPRNAVVL